MFCDGMRDPAVIRGKCIPFNTCTHARRERNLDGGFELTRVLQLLLQLLLQGNRLLSRRLQGRLQICGLRKAGRKSLHKVSVFAYLLI